MRLRPANISELASALVTAGESGNRIDDVDLTRINRVLEYAPEDMTVTVESGITLVELQSVLRQHRQCLMIDPPSPENLSIEQLLAWNLSGPRRFGFGTARDHVIGAKIMLGDGQIIKAGGKVVKNVAGYDLCKLFIGARQSLGLIVEVSFKLRPVPEREEFIETNFPQLKQAWSLVETILASELTPHVLDMHNLTDSSISVVLGFAGSSPEVQSQLANTAKLATFLPATLHYNETFSVAPIKSVSVLPSKLERTLSQLGPIPWVARAGNGIVYYKGEPVFPHNMPITLMRRLKAAYDPKDVLPLFPE